MTLAAPLTQDHIGENFTLTDEQRGPLPANRSRVDMRAAVGHITRNAVVRGGATSAFDEWSGMTVQEQHYGGYIDINPGYESPKFGYDETMSCYLLDPTNLDSCRELLPDGHVSFEFAEFQRIGRGCFFGCSNQGTGIRFQGVTSQERVTMRGCTLRDPLSGSGEMPDEPVISGLGEKALVFVDNVMFGATWQFGGEVGGADHLVKNNLFMGTTDGDACGDKIMNGGCPATTMLRFGGVWGTRLRVEDNLMVGHTFGARIDVAAMTHSNGAALR